MPLTNPAGWTKIVRNHHYFQRRTKKSKSLLSIMPLTNPAGRTKNVSVTFREEQRKVNLNFSIFTYHTTPRYKGALSFPLDHSSYKTQFSKN